MSETILKSGEEIRAGGDELVEKFNKITGDDFDVLKRVSTHCAVISINRELGLLEQLHQDFEHNKYSAAIIKMEINNRIEVLNYLKSKL